jgi:hypothetical protein
MKPEESNFREMNFESFIASMATLSSFYKASDVRGKLFESWHASAMYTSLDQWACVINERQLLNADNPSLGY